MAAIKKLGGITLSNPIKLAACAALFSSLSLGAVAAPVVIDATFELTASDFITSSSDHSTSVLSIRPLASALPIAVGDTVDMTVHFGAGQSLLIQSNGGTQYLTGWLSEDRTLSEPNTSYFTIANATLDLLDSNNHVVRSFSKSSEANGASHLGPAFQGGYLASGESLAFSGYRTTYTVTDLQGGQQYYSGAFLRFAAFDGASVTLVPEPSSLVLSVLGLACLGGLKMRSSSKARRQRPA